MAAYSRSFTNHELAALVGYQLDPGHSDLDNEQPMVVRIVEWDARDLRCTLGDIRKAQADLYAGLRRQLAASLLVETVKNHLKARDALEGIPAQSLHPRDPRFAAVAETLVAVRGAVAQAEAA